MSEANGSLKPLDELRDEYRRRRLAVRNRELALEAQLLEAYTDDFGTIIPPRTTEPGDPVTHQSAGMFPKDRKGTRSFPLIQTEQQLFDVQEAARLLLQTNRFAQGGIQNLRNYTIKTGFVYQAEPEETAKLDQSRLKLAENLAGQVQRFAKRWRDYNGLSNLGWPEREKKIFECSYRDGEVFSRLFRIASGLSRVRFIWPEQVRKPQGRGDDYEWGILTDPDDSETILAYCVHQSSSESEEVPAEDVFHLKRNTDPGIKRGLSDFFSTTEAIEQVRKLTHNTAVGAAVQAALVGFRQHNASQDGAERLREGAKAALRKRSPITNRDVNYQYYPPGSLPDIGSNSNYIPTPWTTAGNANHQSAQEMTLRSIAHRWNMPLWMMAGDLGAAALASHMVAGSPIVNAVECEQEMYCAYLLALHWAAIEWAAQCGVFQIDGRTFSFEEVQSLVELRCTPPAVAIVDQLQQTQKREVLHRNGILSRQSWAAAEGEDFKQTEQDLQDAPPLQQQQQAQQQPQVPESWLASLNQQRQEAQQPPAVVNVAAPVPPDLTPLAEALRLPVPQPALDVTALTEALVGRLPLSPGSQPFKPTVKITTTARDERGLVREIRETTLEADAATQTEALAQRVVQLLECDEGVNKGKPGPCPETGSGDSESSRSGGSGASQSRKISAKQLRAVQARAQAKAKANPPPTEEEVAANREGMERLGANKFRRNLVGNTTDRAKRRKALMVEFGDGESCPCTYCGLVLQEGTLEQDKIKTTAEGGRYRLPNLIPSCSGCNKARGDTPWESIKWS